ncbi:TMED7, partial [Symbiodinium sp. KB8]
VLAGDPAGVARAEQDFELPAGSGPNDALDALEAAKDDEAGGGLVEEWDKHMEGFTPELLLTFPLPGRSDEFFYEDIPENSPPVLIRGGFFASASEETSTVEFSITDPKGNVIFEKKDQAEGLFHFMAKKSGTYTFIVSNHRWMEEKMVTFAVGKGNETHLQPQHLTTMEDHVKSIEKTLVDIQTESTYLWIRQKSHMKAEKQKIDKDRALISPRPPSWRA